MHTCSYCNKVFASYKSWHRHKTLSHPDQIKPLNWKQEEYNTNPVHCLSCGSYLSYEQRHGKFCTHSCSASFNNRIREKKPKKIREVQTKPPRMLQCPTCNTSFQARGSAHRFCSPSCNVTKTGKIHYRNLCRFKLNPRENSSLYNFELIATNGWYRPSNHKDGYNPDGVTWDHLFRVEDGFKLGVSPDIMSHPANAEMVTWRENQKRKTSQITLEELRKRIATWV